MSYFASLGLAVTFIGKSGYLGTQVAALFFFSMLTLNSLSCFLLQLMNVPMVLSFPVFFWRKCYLQWK